MLIYCVLYLKLVTLLQVVFQPLRISLSTVVLKMKMTSKTAVATTRDYAPLLGGGSFSQSHAFLLFFLGAASH